MFLKYRNMFLKYTMAKTSLHSVFFLIVILKSGHGKYVIVNTFCIEINLKPLLLFACKLTGA